MHPDPLDPVNTPARPSSIKPVVGLGRRATSLLGIIILVTIARFAAAVSVARASAQGFDIAPVVRDNPWIVWLEMLTSLLTIACGIVFVVWLRRCVANVRAWGCHTRYGRRWAVAGFIVPFVPHIPIRIVQDVAWASPREDGAPRVSSTTIGVWWLAFLLGQNAPMALRSLVKPTDPVAWRIEALALAVTLAAAGLCIWIIRAITTGVTEIAEGRAIARVETFGQAPVAVAAARAGALRTRVRAIALASVVLLLSGAIAAAAPPATTTASARFVTGPGSTFTVVASKGDRIARTSRLTFDSGDAFEITTVGASMFARIEGWRIDLSWPSTEQLSLGTYARMTGFDAQEDTRGHLAVSTIERGCLVPSSGSKIDRVVYRGTTLLEIALRFTQRCDDGGTLQGTLVWHGKPAPPPTRRRPSGPALDEAYVRLMAIVEMSGGCENHPSPIGCVRTLGAKLAVAWQSFIREVREMDLPPDARPAEARLAQEVRRFVSLLQRFATAEPEEALVRLAEEAARREKVAYERIRALGEATAGDPGTAR